MIDDLAARASLTVAALLLLATGLTTLAPLQSVGIQEAAASLARHLAREIDGISRTDAAILVHGSATDLPAGLAGRPYRAEFRHAEVRVVVDGAIAAASLLVPVYPAAPPSGHLSSGELAAMAAQVLVVSGGASFVIERLPASVDGSPAFLTFVRLPD